MFCINTSRLFQALDIFFQVHADTPPCFRGNVSTAQFHFHLRTKDGRVFATVSHPGERIYTIMNRYVFVNFYV